MARREQDEQAQSRARTDTPSAASLLASALRRALLARQEQGAPEVPRERTKASPVKVPGVSPLAPKAFPDMPAVAGVSLSTAAAGIRYKSRDDMLFATFAPGTAVAGVFTRSTIVGAPVEWCRNCLEGERPTARALVVNAGNANVFTGRAGVQAVGVTAATAAALVKAKKREVFVASTGVIGEPLPVAKVKSALPGLYKNCSGDAAMWLKAARAIMTTDTYPKGATRAAKIDGVPVTVNGIAKGSGMIAPDMATLLSFVFTDATLPANVLQTLLMLGVRDSFNAISADSDTSTSDMALLFATGQAVHAPIARAGDPRLRSFRQALNDVLHDLAMQVVRDGEGASKLIKVTVTGAESAKSARIVARAIVDSPLVKTAIAGGDANWGRIVMAIGKTGEAVAPERLKIRMCNLPVAEKGARAAAHDETALTAAMKAREIPIDVDLGVGNGKSVVWGCDLTHGFIDINGSYRS